MSIARPEDLIVTEIVGDMSIACDFSEHWTCSKGPAEWILHRVRCNCGYGGHALSCTKCKDDRLLASADDVLTCGGCGEAVPALEAYLFIEPLSRPQ